MKKLILGLIVFGTGILLDIVYDITDIFVIRLLAGVLWPIGMGIGINAVKDIENKKKRGSLNQSTEKDNN